jgi:hypothetical protein
LYRGFDATYRRHIEDAGFTVVKGHDFKFLKERLMLVRHVLKGQPDLSPGKRTEIIKALLSDGDLSHAQQVIAKSDKNKDSGKMYLISKLTSIVTWSWGSDDESLRKEMKKMASGISDSNFLLELAGIEDEELKAPIQEVVTLAHTQLSSSIDSTVKKLTHAALRMQEDECRKNLEHEIESEQRKELRGVFVDFIRDVNKANAGRRTSCVWRSCRGR